MKNSSTSASPESVSVASASPESKSVTVTVAVAINHSSRSYRALGWALDQLVSEGQTIAFIHVRHPIRAVPTPMGNYLPATKVCKEVTAAYRKQLESQTKEMLLPYLLLCEGKQVQADIRILEDMNVADAIVKHISESGILTLVMGSRSRNAISRRIKPPDIPAIVAKNAPKSCIIYMILKSKLSTVQSSASSNSTKTMHVDVRRIASFDNGSISTCSSPSTPRDSHDGESSMFQSHYRALSYGDLSMSRNIVKPENAVLQVDKLIRSQSTRIGMCEVSTSERMHSPTAPAGTDSLETISESKSNLVPTNDESQSVSKMDGEARVYSADKTGLEGSAEISKLPSITDVSNPDNESFLLKHEILSNKNEIMDKDQSSSDFLNDKQNSRVDSLGTEMEDSKSQIIGERNETEHTQSSSPKVSEGKELHSLVIPNSEGRGYFQENMDLQTSPAGTSGSPAMTESSMHTEMLFEISISDLEAGRPQVNIVSKNLDRAIVDVEENALKSTMKFSQDFDERSTSGKINEASASEGDQDIMMELETLRLELARIRERYGGAFEEAVAAKKKVQELNHLRAEDSKKLETAKARVELAIAIAAEEMARRDAAVREAEAAKQIAEIEAKERKNAQLVALKNSKDVEKAKKVLISNDEKYRKYSIQEIDNATGFFSQSTKIGEGAYGPVYKCELDHTTVAIKSLRPGSAQGWIQFQQEVEILCRIRHPHIVLLLGACPESGCLVYEYMANGSLEDRLFRIGATPPLPWFVRFRIAWEVASGLFFLHSSKPEPLVHRDLKPANILLDQNFVSKIGDVGLARLVPPSVSCAITQYRKTSVSGTFCYIDPEYQRSGTLGTKSDLYALGVLLLQLLTGKTPEGIAYIVERAIQKGAFSEILDQSVKDWPVDEALQLAGVALKCAEMRRKDRPDLGTVVLPELHKLKDFALGYLEYKRVGNAPQSTTHLTVAAKETMPRNFLCMFMK